MSENEILHAAGMISGVLLTPEGMIRLQEELDQLTTSKRQEIADRLRDCMDHGEFSEDNSELDEVKFEQAMVENRIADLKTTLASAQAIDLDALGTDRVDIGNFVEVKDEEKGIQFKVRLVTSMEADPDNDYVSNESPMGSAIYGAKKGEKITFEAPVGKISYLISKILK